MSHVLRYLVFLSLVISVTGCSSTMKAVKLNDSGYFPTSNTIEQDDVKVEEKFDAKYRAMLYVKTDEKSIDYNKFFIQSFVNMDVFELVLDKEGIENLVIEKGLVDKVTSVSDKIGLYHLQKEIGIFLVVEPYAEYVGGYDYRAELKAYDPETGKLLLHLTNAAFNWAGLDKPLFYPLFNAFLDWTRNKTIASDK